MISQTKFKPTFYTGFWIFVIFGVLGYLFETLICVLRYGRISGTQGLIGLPFSQIYGMGAMILWGVYPRLRTWTNTRIFAFCTLLGGLYEYLASWLQEALLHTTSWDYSHMNTSLGGRTNLLYAFIWGGLCVLVVRKVFPTLGDWLKRMRGLVWVWISWVLFVILLGDSIFSTLACSRMVERSRQLPPDSPFEVFLDRSFPDEVVRKTYPYLKIR